MELASVEAATFLFFLCLILVAWSTMVVSAFDSPWLAIIPALFALPIIAMLVNLLVWLIRVAVGDLPASPDWAN